MKKLDNSGARVIYAWPKKNIDGCIDPRAHGEALNANRAGQRQYRVGNHRIICKVEDEKVIDSVLAVGHRGAAE